jgi:RimJ/RimL family protein N-acetyltransferase
VAWQLTDSIDEFEHAAKPLLRADPVRHTVPLTVLASLRHAGVPAVGDDAPTFGWHSQPDGTVDGAVLQTPPYPLLLAAVPDGSVGDLLALLAVEQALPAAVNVARHDEASFLAAWAAAAGGSGGARLRSRLYQLGELVPPDPAPLGSARQAVAADRDLLIAWHEAFGDETQGAARETAARTVTDRLSHGGLLLWEADGEPVAMAGLTRTVAGVTRVAGVYTPRAHRRSGYGGAVTTAASQTARRRGAAEVVLFTDLANPTSNALYQRLGYRPVEDRVLLDLAPYVTSGQRNSSS